MKRGLLIVVLLALALSLLLPAAAALADAAYPPWMSGDTWPRPEWSGYPIVDAPDSMAWFEIRKLRPNVYAVYEPGNWQEVMSYLFIGRHRAMLYDTGMNIGDMKEVTDWLTDLPVFVVNSHSHPDHTGCNSEYRSVWAMRDRRRAHLPGGLDQRGGVVLPPGCDVAGVADARRLRPGGLLHPALHDHALMQDGDVIDLGNMKFEVIRTQGHSTDGTCLLDRAHRLLLVGDV